MLHLHEPLCPGPTMTACLVKPAPLVATFHAAGVSASYRWFNPGVRFLANRLDIRCVVSHDAQRLADHYLPGDYERLFNGIEVERYAKADPWPTDGPTILFLGRHEPRKGLDVLLAALSSLPPEVRLWVCGEGPETETLRSQHAGDPRIEWLGRVSDVEKQRRLRGADIYCAPSVHGESFGVVLLEAMAASTAIVASDLPGYRNVVRPDRDAVVVPPGRPRRPGRRPAADAGRPRSAGPLGELRERNEPSSSRWTTWPTGTSSSTNGRSLCTAERSGADGGSPIRDHRGDHRSDHAPFVRRPTLCP